MNQIMRTAMASALAAVTFTGLSATAGAKELKLSLLVPEHHILVTNVFKPFKEEVEAASGGALTITLYPAAVLGAGKEQLRLTETGVADIALVVPTYTRGRFPLIETGLLPFAFDSAAHGTRVMGALTADYLDAEFNSVKLLYAAATSPTALLTVNKPLATLADVKGATLRGTGGEQNKVLEALGANLVSVPASDLYVALERGTIEGTILSLASAPGYKLEEIVKYVNRVNFSATPITVVMNLNAWNGLTDEEKQIVTAAAANAAANTGAAYDSADGDGLGKLTAAGAQVVDFPAADVAELKAISAPAWDRWQEELAGKGVDAAAFMAAFRAAIDGAR